MEARPPRSPVLLGIFYSKTRQQDSGTSMTSYVLHGWILQLLIVFNSLETRLWCGCLKLRLTANPASNMLRVLGGSPRVLRTDVYHWVFMEPAAVVPSYQVWHPYHAVQSVCNSLTLMFEGTPLNIAYPVCRRYESTLLGTNISIIRVHKTTYWPNISNSFAIL